MYRHMYSAVYLLLVLNLLIEVTRLPTYPASDYISYVKRTQSQYLLSSQYTRWDLLLTFMVTHTHGCWAVVGYTYRIRFSASGSTGPNHERSPIEAWSNAR